MENKATSKKLFLKPASFQSAKSEQNGNATTENGSATSPLVNNPFLKCDKEEPEVTKKDEKNSEQEKDPASSNLFKPVNTNLFASNAGAGLSENSNFVFGENLKERVVMENVNSTPAANQSDDTIKKNNDAHLFSSAVLATSKPLPEKDNSNEENVEKTEEDGLTQSTDTTVKDGEQKTESLVEAARKYEEMRGAQKRKYEEVEVTTGEEDERNILEISCKLFTFIENNYEERGRGTLRLNDSKSSSHSRVVFRSSGNLRLLLNTKVWRDQICEQPSQKSLRLTAFDANGVIKIYLVMGRNEDMSQLQRALSTRIRREKDRTPEPEEVKPEENSVDGDDDEDGTVEPAIKRLASGSE